MNTADVTIGFVCSSKGMVRERIESVHLERHGIDHEILSVAPGCIPEGHDLCDHPGYRQAHGLRDASTDPKWSRDIPKGCTSYVARVRLRDSRGEEMTRDRIIAIPFGNQDLGFSIDRIGGAD